MTNAPNGSHVTINYNGADIKLEHRQIISNPQLAKNFPTIFIQVEQDFAPQLLQEPAPTPHIKEPTKESEEDFEKQILTEPAPVPKVEVKEYELEKESPESEHLLQEKGKKRDKGRKSSK